MISRDKYLQKLISKQRNGLVKVITGIRRSGKSFLLFKIFVDYLKSSGVTDDQIIMLALDDDENIKYRNPIELGKYLREFAYDQNKQYYILLDEIQQVAIMKNPYTDDKDDKISFVNVVNGLMRHDNIDVYITGSNSKMLSSDILTEFRGRSDEIRILPLTYSEFINAYEGDRISAWSEYYTYGGMPFILSLNSHEDKSNYLKTLFDKIYLSDIMEHNRITYNKSVLDDILDIISSSVGSLTNPSKISNTFSSVKKLNITENTIDRYLDIFQDAFLISKVSRYDIKGRKYIGAPQKYYFTDIGLRNARLGFRQQEENHIMENIIYNELIYRGFDVDIGNVQYNFKDENKVSQRQWLEIDFVANKNHERYYIQSALSVAEEEKRKKEIKSLLKVPDSFKKILVVKDSIIPWHDENGILYIGIEDFLLNQNILKFS